MNPTLLITFYSIAVVASSLFGGWLPSLFRLTHVRMQLVLSFVGGMMLGVGVLHMLPHSFVELGSLDTALIWMLVGLLGMFLLIRTFHFHEHGPASPEPQIVCEHDHDHGESSDEGHAGEHDVAPGHSHEGHHHHQPSGSRISWIGVAFGLSLHAFLDGIALGAGVISDWSHRSETFLAGFSVFLAVLLHKPLDALSITTLMHARGWSHRWQQSVNAGFAMMCPIGAWMFIAWVRLSGAQHYWVGVALAMSAGIFLCISLSDLLPEVQFHRHDRFKLSTALILGVLAAYAIHFVEPPHAHGPPGANGVHDHSAHEHDPAASHDGHRH